MGFEDDTAREAFEIVYKDGFAKSIHFSKEENRYFVWERNLDLRKHFCSYSISEFSGRQMLDEYRNLFIQKYPFAWEFWQNYKKSKK
jgi:hypothetical protein